MWSDGCVTDVVKSYCELHGFHAEVHRSYSALFISFADILLLKCAGSIF